MNLRHFAYRKGKSISLFEFGKWPEFRLPNFKVLEKLMKAKIIIDGRNIFEPSEIAESGFTYYCIGRKLVISSITHNLL